MPKKPIDFAEIEKRIIDFLNADGKIVDRRTMELVCPKHRRYLALRKPTCGCITCDAMWAIRCLLRGTL